MTAQAFDWTETLFAGDSPRTFTAGENLFYIVSLDPDRTYFDVLLMDVSGTTVVERDSARITGNPNVAAHNSNGHLVLYYSYGSNRPAWKITNDGTALTVTTFTVPDGFQPSEYGHFMGPWRGLDTVSLSPDGSELVGGAVENANTGYAWGIDTSDGTVAWSATYAIPTTPDLSTSGPCIGTTAPGTVVAYYDFYDYNTSTYTAYLYLIDATGVVDTLAIPFDYRLAMQGYWTDLGGALAYATYQSTGGGILRTRAVEVSATTLAWAGNEVEISAPGWADYGDDPYWSAPRDAWAGQMVLFPGLAATGDNAGFWVDPTTGTYATDTSNMQGWGDIVQAHAAGPSTSLRIVATSTDGTSTLYVEKWAAPPPPAPVGVTYDAALLGWSEELGQGEWVITLHLAPYLQPYGGNPV